MEKVDFDIQKLHYLRNASR